MATVTRPEIDRDAATPGDQCVALRDVGWDGYRKLLKLRGERPRPRMVYLDGTVWLMSPAEFHERLAARFDWLVLVLVEELELPCIPTRSTTFRRRKQQGGVEADQSYYLANVHRIEDKDEIDLRVDPPPDLAIEVVNTNPAEHAIEAYRRLGVPEVWIYEDGELRILTIRPGRRRRYDVSATSPTFPTLTAAEIDEWIGRPRKGDEREWSKSFRTWVREVLVPRVRRPVGGVAEAEAEGGE